MKLYEKKVVPERVTEMQAGLQCDLCGAKSKHRDDWATENFEDSETEIKISGSQREGTSYPEGGIGTEYEIDLCPKCFKERLVPWLRSEGAKIEETEWYW